MAGKFTSYSAGYCIVFLGSFAFLPGCTTNSVLTSSYAPQKNGGVYYYQGRDPGSVARDRAIAARPDPIKFNYAEIYAAKNDDGVHVPAFDYSKMSRKYLRTQVRYLGPEQPGTIVVDAQQRRLYLIQPRGMAIRYGIAVGKEGYGWIGNSVLQWKQKWPSWTPPAEMIERKPELKKYADGLKGSPANPLGARAMYLFKNGKDTLYRIHGTTKPYSIGRAASSGCFRMINQDVIDLYDRVGTKGSVQVRTRLSSKVLVENSRQ